MKKAAPEKKDKKRWRDSAPKDNSVDTQATEVFVCDYCFKFEGTFSVVQKHEKTCPVRTKPSTDAARAKPAAPTDEKPAVAKKTKAKDGKAVAKPAEVDAGGGNLPPLSAEMSEKLEAWVQAKRQRNFETSDRLRAEMKDAGFNPEEHRPKPGGITAPPLATGDAKPNHPPFETKAEKRKWYKQLKKAKKREEAGNGAAGGGAQGGPVPQLQKKRSASDGPDGDDSRGKPAAKRARQDAAVTYGEAAAAAAAPREVRLRKGVCIVELGQGSGPAVQDRKRVKVSYVGRLGSSTGAVFDKGTIAFRLGRGEVIDGWDIGVQGMRLGSKRRITVPPGAGYGNQAMPGDPGIPARSTLCFDVTVVS